MTTIPRSPLRDPELVEMLADDPELFALADAVASTRMAPPAARERFGLPRLLWLGAAAALLAGAATAALIAPWTGRPSLADRALAAVGDQPVLHLVIARPAVPGALVEIDTGKPIGRTERTEIWFDRGRDLEKTVTTLEGHVLDETLETDQGGFSLGGPIITCAWIAAHPVEATKLRVSCNLSGENGTVPRNVPERPPTLDPALADFVDRYQSALASGRAHEVGRGRLDGREVVWLELTDAAAPGSGLPERVAVDAVTYKPVLVESAGGATSFRVLTAETVAFQESLFTKPEQVDAPAGGSGGSTTSSTDVSPQEAAAVLGGTAVWLGPEFQDYRLFETKRDELAIGYGPLSHRKPTHTTGVEFVYARVGVDGSVDKHATLTLAETTVCTVVWGWTCSARDPVEPGTMLTLVPRSLVRDHGLYVTIWDWNLGAQPPPLEVARALRPVG